MVGELEISGGGRSPSSAFRQTEVQNFHCVVIRKLVVACQLDVCGFQIAMNDAALVRVFHRFADLLGDGQRLLHWNRASLDAIPERRPFHQLHHQRMRLPGILEAVDCGDVRMIERGKDLRFAMEPRHLLAIGCKPRRQHLQRHFASQPRIPRAIHLAHSTRAQRRHNLIRAQLVARGKGHKCATIISRAALSAKLRLDCRTQESNPASAHRTGIRMRSRLVGSDLCAWHRSGRDYGTLGSNALISTTGITKIDLLPGFVDRVT